jgi:site-specific recombinase XerD
MDLERRVILIAKTKNGSERLAPINDSMEAVLRQYLTYRGKLHFTNLLSPDSYLFVSSLGGQCTRSCVLRWFSKIRQNAGIPYKGNHEGPRVHDLRHTACCHSLANLASKGRDVYCSLPLMTTFMGHKKVMGTEHYLRLTQEMYPELIRLDESVTASISTVISRTIFTDDDGEI